MKTSRIPLPKQFILAGLSLLLATGWLPTLAEDSAPPLKKTDIDRLMKDLSNWQRWGKDDQLGAVNLITPEKRRKAAALVKDGISISLGHDAVTEKAMDNPSPFSHKMDKTGLNSDGGASDTFSVTYHGMVHTHMDALCHLFYKGKMFNGYPKDLVIETGAKKLGIENLKNGIFTRGILMDIPKLKGVKYLEPGEAIYPADLAAWEKKIGVKAGPGDVLLIRTGRWTRRLEKGPQETYAGLHASCAKWIKERDIAILGSDAASDVMPSGVEGVEMPIHQLMLNTLGVWILDNADFEELSKEAEKRERWEFLLTISPLRVVGGTGSPLNPIATF